MLPAEPRSSNRYKNIRPSQDKEDWRTRSSFANGANLAYLPPQHYSQKKAKTKKLHPHVDTTKRESKMVNTKGGKRAVTRGSGNGTTKAKVTSNKSEKKNKNHNKYTDDSEEQDSDDEVEVLGTDEVQQMIKVSNQNVMDELLNKLEKIKADYKRDLEKKNDEVMKATDKSAEITREQIKKQGNMETPDEIHERKTMNKIHE